MWTRNPPRLAFYLTHEVGHILRGHVVPGGDMLVDTDLDQATEDLQERDADGDALEILTGNRSPGSRPRFGLTAARLVNAVRQHEAEHRIHAGTVALVYGKTAGRMPAAAAALKLMKMDKRIAAVLSSAGTGRPQDCLAGANSFLAGLQRELGEGFPWGNRS